MKLEHVRQDGVGKNQGQIEAPAPTIVGPRPAENSGRKITIPQGLERLLIMAGLSPEWQKKTLADPLQTAAEAQIELSASERAILKSVSPQSLAGMIASFARHQWQVFKGPALAAGAAAAALLAAEGDGYAQMAGPHAKGGALADTPPSQPIVQPSLSLPSLPAVADALAKAQASSQVVMVCFGQSGAGDEVKKAADDAKILVVNMPLPAEGSAEERSYKEMLANYWFTNTAAIIFLMPDGNLLTKTAAADAVKQVEFIKTVPSLMAKWIARQRPADPRPVTRGIGHDMPRPKPVVQPVMPAVADALARARASTQAVMVCCGQASVGDEVKKAADEAKLLVVNVPTPAAGAAEEKNYKDMLASYQVTNAAATVFLAPDGKVLSKTAETDAAKLVEFVKTIPALLAKWIADKRPDIRSPEAAGGARADVPSPNFPK